VEVVKCKERTHLQIWQDYFEFFGGWGYVRLVYMTLPDFYNVQGFVEYLFVVHVNHHDHVVWVLHPQILPRSCEDKFY
jgi:hypothetical protein